MDKLFIVMPAYNEEANIEHTVEQWYPVLEGKSGDSKLVIADSGSTDKTHEVLLQLQKKYPQLEILHTEDRQHGPKLMELYQYAIQQNADYVFQTDSDGQTNPEEFAKFWQQRELYDGIFGNRTVRGDGKSRAFVENVVCMLLKLYFGVKIPDANAPFRLIHTKTLDKYLNQLPMDYNIPNIMLTTYFVFYQEKYKFEMISFKPRMAGKNSVNVKRIVETGMKAMKDFHGFKQQMKKSSSQVE